jgi:hypothetical protein
MSGDLEVCTNLAEDMDRIIPNSFFSGERGELMRYSNSFGSFFYILILEFKAVRLQYRDCSNDEIRASPRDWGEPITESKHSPPVEHLYYPRDKCVILANVLKKANLCYPPHLRSGIQQGFLVGFLPKGPLHK